jgi:hypothetical protein
MARFLVFFHYVISLMQSFLDMVAIVSAFCHIMSAQPGFLRDSFIGSLEQNPR